jgi:hypothetical protein
VVLPDLSPAADAVRSLAAALLACLWLGAALFFAAVVAPGAFAALQSHELAGGLIVRVLPPLFYAGLAVGLVAAMLVETTRRRWAAVTMAAACAVAQFVVAPRIEHLRSTIAGPVDALPGTDPRQGNFALLHGASVLLLLAAMVWALVIVIAAWRSYGTQYSR